MHLYCVKIKQLQLRRTATNTYDYFPFDRVYLLPKDKKKLALKLFRFSLLMPLDDRLREALEQVHFTKQYQLDSYRNDKHLEGTTFGAPDSFDMFTDIRQGDWLVVIPTYLARDRDINPDAQVPVSREVRLAYTLSSAVRRLHNLKAVMPAITLHTPTTNVPFICALCKHIAEYHSNQCTLGQSRCRERMRLNGLPIADDARQMLEKSVKGSGEEQ